VKRPRVFLASLGRRTVSLPNSTPPMGILCLAAYVRSKLDVELLLMDQRVENASMETLVRRAADFGADVVGLSVMTPCASMLGPLTQGLRAALPKAFIVLGGPHVSALQEGALGGNVASAAVAGEGECALEQVIRVRQERGDLTDVSGLIWRDEGGAIIRNRGVAPVIENLDALPFPAYDLLDVSKYWVLPPMTELPPHKYLSLFSSRGCPCKCIYCHAVFGKRPQAGAGGLRLDCEAEFEAPDQLSQCDPDRFPHRRGH
jgi:anaerobic magnesium-protoporphyrin IX monomethyl ester cyclase